MIVCTGSNTFVSAVTAHILAVPRCEFTSTEPAIGIGTSTDRFAVIHYELQVTFDRYYREPICEYIRETVIPPKNFRWYHRFTRYAQPYLTSANLLPVGIGVRRTQEFQPKAQRNAAKRRAHIQYLRQSI